MLRPIFLQCRIGDLVALELPNSTKVALELSGIYVKYYKIRCPLDLFLISSTHSTILQPICQIPLLVISSELRLVQLNGPVYRLIFSLYIREVPGSIYSRNTRCD